MLKQTVLYLVKQLVSRPDVVKVEDAEVEQGKAIKILVDKQDVGKVIGKDGQSIKAIRAIISLFKNEQEPFVTVIIDS